ncbi:MAG: glycosyltransferase family 2 protein [Bacteroidales bacterium]|nr:glycosyltransferase family 2 protein [Bacteroidales bacterium]
MFDVLSLAPVHIDGASHHIEAPDMHTTRGLMNAAVMVASDYVLFITTPDPVEIDPQSVARLVSVARQTGSAMVYSDYREIKGGIKYDHQLIMYQAGSIRDDFEFGPVFLVKAEALRIAAELMDHYYDFAALYDMRLKLARFGHIYHLPEFLYTKQEKDLRASGVKQFDYVDPRNRNVQIENEQVCTDYLKSIGAFIEPSTISQCSYDGSFPVEVSVVIPVFNRESTVADAVASALMQQTDFKYNVIVVDNHSTDRTTEILAELVKAANDKLVHIVPSRTDLGIGGCWNEAVFSHLCGRFVVQLDSDDLYIDQHTLQKIVDKFRSENCAMVVGAYNMVDFNLSLLPPGTIDHREWTPDNGRNNALRVNGLGAPRAFVTSLLRENPFANVSYGEDYAQGLRFCREYNIGRIFEPLYLCRRWTGNSDSHLDQEHINRNNYYKDSMRTIEVCARVALNMKRGE